MNETAVVNLPRRGPISVLAPGLSAEQGRAFGGVLLASFVISLGIGVIFPLVPGFARELGLSVSFVGLLVSAFGVSRVVVDLAGGHMFRRVSERVGAAAGAVVVALGSLLTALADERTGLLVGRVLHGVGVALFVVAGAVYIGREAPLVQRARLLGLHQGSMILGTSLGPVVGAVLAMAGGLRFPFLVAAVAGALAAPYSLRVFPRRTTDRVLPSAKEQPVAGPLKWSLYVAYASYFLVWAARSAIRFALIPLFVEESLGKTAAWSAVLLGVMSSGDIVGFVAGGRFVDRVGRRPVLIGGFLISAGVVSLCGYVGSVERLLPLGIVFGLVGGYLAIAPAAMVADIAGQRPSSITTSRLAGDVGIIVGPLIGTVLVDGHGYGIAFVAHGLTFLVGAALALTARETRNQLGDGTYNAALT